MTFAAAAWERFWFDPIAAIRPYLLMRAVYAVLALDLWIVTMPRGGRYGFGGFNAAHFGWLDAVQPLPTAALYVGLLLFIGFLALVCAFCDPGRWARALVAVLHTGSWAMSLHDTYQHHYFLSLVLIAFVFFPRGAARALLARDGAGRPAVSSWAFVLLLVNVALVYAFAALSKLDVAWRTGEVLRQAPLSRLGAIQVWANGVGIPAEGFWSAAALGVVAAEWTVAAGYLVGAWRDRSRSRWVAAIAGLTCALAVGFHAGAEAILSLRIGWFTYYMFLIAAIGLLPSGWLHAATAPALRAAAWLDARVAGADGPTGRWLGAGALAAAALAAAGVGVALDLPGAPAAGVAAAASTVAAVVGPRLLGRVRNGLRPRGGPAPLALGVAGALAAAAMGTAVAASDARLDYYMAVGRQLEHFGDRTAATDAYTRAGRYGSPPLDGLWGSGGSRLRVSIRNGEATGVFDAVGDGARRIGFKPGDVSFVARVTNGQFDGRMTFRYETACYPEGRAVPVIGLLRRDGDTLVMHYYNLALDADCGDTGGYTIADTIWNRIRVGAR